MTLNGLKGLTSKSVGGWEERVDVVMMSDVARISGTTSGLLAGESLLGVEDCLEL